MRERRIRKKTKRMIFIIIMIISLTLLIISGIEIIRWFIDKNNTNNHIKEIESNTQIVVDEDDNDTELVNPEEKESDYWYYITFPLISVDFSELNKKNPDTTGWLKVNNTNINYPFVQAKDNDYYLHRSYDKSYNEAGWVFLDSRNQNDLSDKNNIIYAHSRLDKTMFGDLSKVLHSSWYSNKDNHIINISTPTENTLWQIFSVYKIPVETYYITTSFVSDESYLNFLNTIKDRSIHKFSAEVNSDDKILTLSTCYSDTVRTVVHAKLIKRTTRN